MATDQEVAQQILGQSQQQPADDVPVDPAATPQVPPASLMANPAPDALTGATPASNINVPYLSPDLANAAQQAQADQVAQSTLHVPDALTGLVPDEVRANEAAANPSTATAPAQLAASVQPSAEEQAQADQTIQQPVSQAIADHKATTGAQRDLQAEFHRQLDQEEALAKQTQDAINKQDDFVRQKSLPEIMQRGSFGDKLQASIALLLGGVSQGLTGAKSNPVMDFIDKQVAAQAEKDKLSQENKLALKKQLLDVAQLRLQNLAHKSEDLYHRQSIEQEAQKISVLREKVEGDQKLKASVGQQKLSVAQARQDAFNGKPLTDTTWMTKNDWTQVVTGPDGQQYMAKASPGAVAKFNTQKDAISGALDSIKQINQLAANYTPGVPTIQNINLGKQIKTLQDTLVGGLKGDFFGNARLTLPEIDIINKAKGDLTKVLAVPGAERAKFNTIESTLKRSLDRGYKEVGIKPQQTNNDVIQQAIEAERARRGGR